MQMPQTSKEKKGRKETKPMLTLDRPTIPLNRKTNHHYINHKLRLLEDAGKQKEKRRKKSHMVFHYDRPQSTKPAFTTGIKLAGRGKGKGKDISLLFCLSLILYVIIRVREKGGGGRPALKPQLSSSLSYFSRKNKKGKRGASSDERGINILYF